MARGRAKLTEKQERILIQAQLMGLTARDMQQIGNRLIALQKEARDRQEIENYCQGFSWEKTKDNEWRVTTPEGHVVETHKTGKFRTEWNRHSIEYDFKVYKPGTRFKIRNFKKTSASVELEWRKKLMPEQSKELYGVIRWIKNHSWNWL